MNQHYVGFRPHTTSQHSHPKTGGHPFQTNFFDIYKENIVIAKNLVLTYIIREMSVLSLKTKRVWLDPDSFCL